MTHEEHGTRHIEVSAEASTIEGWKKQARAGQKDTDQFTIVADEGAYMPGGEGTAPTPLTYFVAGLAMCVLSQATNIALRKKLAIRNERVRVTARYVESGSILKGDKRGEATSYAVEILIDSDEPREVIADLMRMAHRMCFAEDSIGKAIPLEYKHQLNGEAIEV